MSSYNSGVGSEISIDEIDEWVGDASEPPPEEQCSSIGDFVRDSEDGLSHACTLEVAERLLAHLVESRMSPIEILVRISKTMYAVQLLERLYIQYKEDYPRDLRSLVDAIFLSPLAVWSSIGEGDLSEDQAMQLTLSIMNARELFIDQGEFLCDETHPLFGVAEELADEYWEGTVCHFVQRGDLKRAWDEVVKSRKGLRKSNKRPAVGGVAASQRFYCDPENRCYQASEKCMIRIVHCVYDALCEEGQINPVTSEDHVFNRRRIKPAIPGLDFAKYFGSYINIREGGDVFLSRTGAEVLVIAKYFSGLKFEKRKQQIKKQLSV